jgi:serine protease Do
MKYFFACILPFVFALATWSQDNLKKETMDLIDETVFEVVILKPEKDSLSYEKMLPLDKIPYSIRKDLYYSIGTAFTVSKGEFISASHVFDFEIKTQSKNFYIRDKKGNVYELDKILYYDNFRDFVKFTVKDYTNDKVLTTNTSPIVNDTVFAVGNAFGEGIIIRNGVYTSKTPEDENGQWEWLRFSAAASPGNSGGPLLDKNGNVIGIVLKKSKNENLNYALPISMVDTDENAAKIHKRINYSFLVINDRKNTVFDYKTKLPMNYHELTDNLVEKFSAFCAVTLNDLLEEHKNIMFPNGKGSLEVLHSVFSATFPNIIAQKEDGNWASFRPNPDNRKKYNIDEGGYVEFGNMSGIDMVYFQAPGNLNLRTVYDDPKIFMDTLLKGIIYNREVMDENIRITSFGKEYEKLDYIDKYQRKWLIRTWLVEYNDNKLITFSLPVPGGTVTLIKYAPIGAIESGIFSDFKEMANFINISYIGTFKEWKEFLGMKEYLPAVFNNIEFSFVPGNNVKFKSDRVNLEYNASIQDISDDSEMKLYVSYFKDKGNVVWDIAAFDFWENKNNDNYFSLSREIKPEKGMKESYFTEWNKMIRQENPFNKTPYVEKQSTYIKGIHSKYDFLKKYGDGKIDFIYMISIGIADKIDNFKIKKKYADINSMIRISE